jgi:hypothetical protein
MIWGCLLSSIGSFIGISIGGTSGAFTAGAIIGVMNAAIYGGKGMDFLLAAVTNGVFSAALYQAQMAINYAKYNHGIKNGDIPTFDGHKLNYSQFMQVSKDYAYSKLWHMERGGFFVGDKIVPFNPAGRRMFFIENIQDTPPNSWGTYHTHWCAIEGIGIYKTNSLGNEIKIGETFFAQNIEWDIPFDISRGLSSLVLTPFNDYYHQCMTAPSYTNPYFMRGPLYIFLLGL